MSATVRVEIPSQHKNYNYYTQVGMTSQIYEIPLNASFNWLPLPDAMVHVLYEGHPATVSVSVPEQSDPVLTQSYTYKPSFFDRLHQNFGRI